MLYGRSDRKERLKHSYPPDTTAEEVVALAGYMHASPNLARPQTSPEVEINFSVLRFITRRKGV